MFEGMKKWFTRVPYLNAQHTGNYVYQRPVGLSAVAWNGNGGQGVLRTMAATAPAGIAPGPTLRTQDFSATGNINTGLQLMPLSKNNLNADADSGMLGSQF